MKPTAPRSTARWLRASQARNSPRCIAGSLPWKKAHAQFWQQRLEEATGKPVPAVPGWRTRILIALTRRFGTGLALHHMASQEAGADRRCMTSSPKPTGT